MLDSRQQESHQESPQHGRDGERDEYPMPAQPIGNQPTLQATLHASEDGSTDIGSHPHATPGRRELFLDIGNSYNCRSRNKQPLKRTTDHEHREICCKCSQAGWKQQQASGPYHYRFASDMICKRSINDGCESYAENATETTKSAQIC